MQGRKLVLGCGLLLALVAIGLWILDLSRDFGASTVQLRGLEQSLTALRSELAEAKNGAANLTRRLDDVERTAPAPFDPSALLQQIDAVRADVGELRARPVPPAFDASPISRRLDDVERKVPAPFDPSALLQQIDAVRADVGELKARPVPPAFDASPISRRLDSIDQALARTNELRQRVRTVEDTLASRSAAERNTARPIAPSVRMFFESNSVAISPNGREALLSLIGKDEHKDHRYIIQGYADPVGSSIYNQNLSLRRAIAVQQILESFGIRRENVISVEGLGMEGAPNKDGRSTANPNNRAVDIFVLQ